MTAEVASSPVARARHELADRIEGLAPEQWESDSWCSGWRVRDVLGHLVSTAEASKLSITWLVVRSAGRPDHAMDRGARSVSGEPVPELCQRLRASGDSQLGGSAAMGLGDVLVHSCDILAPLGEDDITMSPDELLPILKSYSRSGRVVVHSAPGRGKRLVATDTDWSTGDGPEIRGRARDLMLLLANRRQVVPLLGGPGTAGL